jgi:hypothetical protein
MYIPALSLNNLKIAARHPSFVIAIAKGTTQPKLAKLHASIELTRTKKLFEKVAGNVPKDHVLDVISYLARHCWNKCYTKGYLYAICRWYRPQVVVETGVCYGISTLFILSALDDNQTGKLFSVDAPNRTYSKTGGTHSDLLPKGCEPGFIIPQSLRSRWSLILGTSRKKLPQLLNQLGYLDLFHHDSEHSYGTMTYEYKTAWPYLRQGGLLLSDDVLWNKAFLDFCHTVNCRYTIFRGKGFAYKI